MLSSLLGRGLRAIAMFSLVSGIALGMSACGDDISAVVSCSTVAECPVPMGMVTVECCSGSCVVASSGCDTGYRYVTSAPDVGECVAVPLCPVILDMSVPEDLSEPPVEEDAGE